MRRFLSALTAASTAALLGCSVAGSWVTIAVDPPSKSFPIETISLDRQNNYTATGPRDGEKQTTTGRYAWNGFTLSLMQPAGPPRSFAGRVTLDGKLLLTDRERKSMTATLSRVGE